MTTEKAFRRTVPVASCALVLLLVVASLNRIHTNPVPVALPLNGHASAQSKPRWYSAWGGTVEARIIIQPEEEELIAIPE